MEDDRIVYGVRCSWWDSIDKVGHTKPGPDGHSLPCCPHCGSVLFEVPKMLWENGIDAYVLKEDPNYQKMIEWMRGKCFPNFGLAKAAYLKANP